MSNQSEEKLAAIQAEAQTLLEEMKQFKAKAEAEFKAAEASRKLADEHASYANQAKINTEEHSKATAIFKGTAESDQNAIAANMQKSGEALSVITRAKADIEADTKAINDRRKEVEQASTGIKEAAEKGVNRLQEIEASKTSADTCLRETEAFLTKAAAAQTQAELSSSQASDLTQKITTEHTTSTRLSGEMNTLLTAATAEHQRLAEIITHFEKSHLIATEFETRLRKSSEQMDALIAKATGLLPGFASASLAHSFNEEKKRFAGPQKRWLGIFVGCIVGLGVVAAPSFFAAVFGTPADSWGAIFRGMAMRLPIVVPLVWLAIYAGRNYMLSLRLEEDYAYKEAISKAFEGYKREMKEIAADDTASPTPINKLCVNVLTAIAERPGRIYEGKHKDITPLNEAVNLSQKQLATQ